VQASNMKGETKDFTFNYKPKSILTDNIIDKVLQF